VRAVFETIVEQPILLVENNQDDILLILKSVPTSGSDPTDSGRHQRDARSGVSARDAPLRRPSEIPAARVGPLRHHNAGDGRV